jgi:hypothetical protein
MILYLGSGDLQFSVYKGEWAADRPQGKGIFYHNSKSGIIIEGTFIDHGKTETQRLTDFKILYPSGDVYEGTMQNNRRNGKGRLFYPNGDLYEGEWLDDRRNGPGKLSVKKEDAVIEGLFSDDYIVEGKVTDRHENVFQGRFLRGKLNGRVNVRYANGDTFQGEYRDGKKCGHGVHNYTNL